MEQKVAADRRDIQWNYTLVLKETVGVGIDFETFEAGAGEQLLRREPFRRRLEARSEPRLRRYYGASFRAAGASGFDSPYQLGGRV